MLTDESLEPQRRPQPPYPTNPSHQPNASNTPHNPQKHKPETTKDTKTPSMAQQEERHRKDTKRHRCVEKFLNPIT